MTVEVENVDLVHDRAVELGFEVVYPLADEDWGVRRFFVKDPNGIWIELLQTRRNPAR